MNWIDVIIVALIAGYGLLGYRSGTVRRVVGFAALYMALGAGTYLSHSAAKTFGYLVANDWVDQRLWMYGVIAVAVLAVIEVVGALYHRHLQITVVPRDAATGAGIGVVTGVVFAGLALYVVGNAVGGERDYFEAQVWQGLTNSRLAAGTLDTGGLAGKYLFYPVLPENMARFFQGDIVRRTLSPRCGRHYC
jgi:uncharacterized membrane protein required for colicin V production